MRERSSIERTFSSARISPFRMAAHTTPIAQSVLAARFWMENFKADFQRLSFIHCRVLIQLFRSFKVVLKSLMDCENFLSHTLIFKSVKN